jgi:hypothetical protein
MGPHNLVGGGQPWLSLVGMLGPGYKINYFVYMVPTHSSNHGPARPKPHPIEPGPNCLYISPAARVSRYKSASVPPGFCHHRQGSTPTPPSVDAPPRDDGLMCTPTHSVRSPTTRVRVQPDPTQDLRVTAPVHIHRLGWGPRPLRA